MLRLTLISQSTLEIVVAIDGWISGEGVGLLEQEGEKWLWETGHLVFDLEGVRFIDQAGINLFQRWVKSEKLGLRGGAVFVQTLLAAHGLASALPSETPGG